MENQKQIENNRLDETIEEYVKVSWNGSSYRLVIPKEAAEQLGIDADSTVRWHGEAGDETLSAEPVR